MIIIYPIKKSAGVLVTEKSLFLGMESTLSTSMLTTPLTSADKDADPPADIAADNGLPGRPQGCLIAAGRRMIWLKKSLHHRPAWRDFGGKNTSISRQEMTPKTKEFPYATRTRNIFRSTFS